MTGDLSEAARACSRALRVGRESGIMENLGWALGNLAYHAELSGEVASEELGDANAAVLEALRIAEELGSAFSRAIAYAQLATLHLLVQEWDQAERLYTDALDIMRSRRVRLESECNDLTHLARVQLGRGEVAASRSTAAEAVTRAKERGQGVWELLAQLALAESVAAEQGSQGRAAIEAAFTRVAELVRETGARAYEPRLAESRARVAAACCDAEAADRHLRDALALYREIGATGHARRVERELEGTRA
jgi:tetratricopeptide (TPR) repeat protein